MTESAGWAWKRAELAKELRRVCLDEGPVTLSSGARSNYYFDVGRFAYDQWGFYDLGFILVHDAVAFEPFDAVAGPALGAAPLVCAMIAQAVLAELPGPSGFLVRSGAEPLWPKSRLEGAVPKAGARVLLLDDVVTTGNSLIRAVTAVRHVGLEVAGAVCVILRDPVAQENLKRVGVQLHALFTAEDILNAPA